MSQSIVMSGPQQWMYDKSYIYSGLNPPTLTGACAGGECGLGGLDGFGDLSTGYKIAVGAGGLLALAGLVWGARALMHKYPTPVRQVKGHLRGARRGRTMADFIKENRHDIDAIIKRRCSNCALNDRARREWISNDEGLYLWARSYGVRV